MQLKPFTEAKTALESLFSVVIHGRKEMKWFYLKNEQDLEKIKEFIVSFAPLNGSFLSESDFIYPDWATVIDQKIVSMKEYKNDLITDLKDAESACQYEEKARQKGN